MITAVILQFTKQEYRFLWLQPNQEFGTKFGNGWKGVWHWCLSQTGQLDRYMTGISPPIDLLIVQMDADVARCENEAYCFEVNIGCSGQGIEDPLNCSIAKVQGCTQSLPPNSVCNGSPESLVEYLTACISKALCLQQRSPVVITIPCDSTDSWIVAAFDDDVPAPESICSPWETIISRRKDYHDIRIPNRKKGRIPYSKMILQVCSNWGKVKNKCPQAAHFETNIRNILCIV